MTTQASVPARWACLLDRPTFLLAAVLAFSLTSGSAAFAQQRGSGGAGSGESLPPESVTLSPFEVTADAIVGYERPITRRIKWRTQINVNNVLDWLEIERAPNIATGVVDNALLRNDPLTWVWTNTLRF